MNKKNLFIYLLTFVVAYCSIIYELIYSQSLTVIFGGTVKRYSITIGLFLVSLGIGSFLYRYLFKRKPLSKFFNIEVLLSIIGPLGLILIFYINSHPLTQFQTFIFIISHIPIVLVGILSGLEIPALSSMVTTKNSFSEVLGFDYIGSLAGTVVFSMYLYTKLGLVSSAILTGFLNLVVAILFNFIITKKTSKSQKLKIPYKIPYKLISLKNILTLIILILYLFVLFNHENIQQEVSITYRLNDISKMMNNQEITILEHFDTNYQEITKWELGSLTCLNIDKHTEVCNSWADKFHSGLIDVPMAFINGKEVLLLGGGDWISINHLRKYDVNIDHIDIDEEFIEYTKTDPFLSKYHNNSFEYNKLNTIIDDAFFYLQKNTKKYDLIVIDLPGVRHDKFSHLYSVEFYSFILKSLKDNGILVIWDYPSCTVHTKILMNTLNEAGLKKYLSYHAYDDDGVLSTNFFLITSGHSPNINLENNDYVKKFQKEYSGLEWDKIPIYEGIKPNSIFKPNYNIVISKRC